MNDQVKHVYKKKTRFKIFHRQNLYHGHSSFLHGFQNLRIGFCGVLLRDTLTKNAFPLESRVQCSDPLMGGVKLQNNYIKV